MHHPLINPTLAPYGFAFPIMSNRLEYVSDDPFNVDPEKMMAKLWGRSNTMLATRPLPIEQIVHHLLPSLAQAHRLTKGDFQFDGKYYLARDIKLLSTVMQWFGTNCGECFLTSGVERVGWSCFKKKLTPTQKRLLLSPEREFLVKFVTENEQRDMVVFWAHDCNSRCHLDGIRHFVSDPHHYVSESVTVRDRAVVDALMRWLGSAHGRAFTARYLKKLAAARKERSTKRMAAMLAHNERSKMGTTVSV